MQPSEILKLLPDKFGSARDSGDLIFYPSTITKHEESNIQYEIRLCPALKKKPTQPEQPDDVSLDESKDLLVHPNEKKLIDPFSPPYNENLHVGELECEDGEEHVVLLNKFSLIPEHFLLVTKEFRSQSSPLLPSDLIQIFSFLAAARKVGKRLLAFYNCGDQSGASQPHKHVQFIPIEDDGPPMEILARKAVVEKPDKPFSIGSLPYANHIFRLPSELSSSTPEKIEHTLATAFMSLLDLVITSIRHDPTYPAGKPSYNFLLTTEHMHLIPRKSESYELKEETQCKGETVNINSLGFAGLVLVKSEEEIEAVKKEGIGRILTTVGIDASLEADQGSLGPNEEVA